MKYSQFLNESNAKVENELSAFADEPLYIKGKNIYAKRDDKLIVKNYHQYADHSLKQKVKDHIDKHYPADFDLEDSIDSLIYSTLPNKAVDEMLVKAREYSHKPVYCIASDDIEKHNYVIGFTGSLNNIKNTIGLPKEGYSIYILDGKFKAIKTRLDNGLLAYVISPSYKLKNADGMDELEISNNVYKVKHIRRNLE